MFSLPCIEFSWLSLLVGQILAKKTSNRALFHKSMKLDTGIDHGTRSNFSYGPADKMSNSGRGIHYN